MNIKPYQVYVDCANHIILVLKEPELYDDYSCNTVVNFDSAMRSVMFGNASYYEDDFYTFERIL